MNWIKSNELPKRPYGWFAAALVPRNHSETKDLDNDWRSSFGFTKAWFNNGRWFESDAHGHGMRDVTDRVTHWAEMPQVPELTDVFESSDNNFLERSRNSREYLTKLAMEQLEEGAKTNPSAVNPHAFVYGFIAAFRLIGIR